MSSPVNKSPLATVPEHDERPERMRDWICRMVNSGRFHGLEWINPEKTIFRVPWIHAKKRGYCKERDAALFREWAIHSGKYRDESDPTVWKINFRCAINGLKDIMEIKDLQTEDCRVYKVLPSRRTRRKPRRRFPNVEPYGPILTAESKYCTQSMTFPLFASAFACIIASSSIMMRCSSFFLQWSTPRRSSCTLTSMPVTLVAVASPSSRCRPYRARYTPQHRHLST